MGIELWQARKEGCDVYKGGLTIMFSCLLSCANANVPIV